MQRAFVALFGPRASAEWVAEHNAVIAHHVQAAVDRATTALGNPNGPPPDQGQYYPALQNLLNVVNAANATYASGGTP